MKWFLNNKTELFDFTLDKMKKELNFPPTDVGYCPVKLGMMSSRLQSGVNTLQGFREDKRNQISLGKIPPRFLFLHVNSRATIMSPPPHGKR